MLMAKSMGRVSVGLHQHSLKGGKNLKTRMFFRRGAGPGLGEDGGLYKGQTITRALQLFAGIPMEVQVQGTWNENVLINRDDVTFIAAARQDK
jgi:hypothetical protein